MSGPDSDRYRIAQKLGAGGRGAVYLATDTSLARTVAIKILDHGLVDEARASVLREARAASALNHPHICTVHEVTDVDGRPCIVMEYVEGASLADAIPPGGFAADIVLRYGAEIADALAHAHERGVIHRDLKSANVMVTTSGRTKVLDFGLARRERVAERYYPTEVDASVATDDRTSGTLPYMSPELLAGHQPSAADDIWALGVLLYELTTGALPFRGETRFELATAIQRDPPAALPGRVPAGLRAVILRCLSRDASARYGKAREVRAALEALQAAGRTIRTTNAAPVRRLGAVAALAAIAMAVAAVAWLVPDWPAPAPRPAAIAVLPFENRGNDRALDYLANGIPESVIKGLSRLPEKLAVTGWTAVQQYRGRIDVQAVAQALSVATLLRGAVVQRQDGTVVTVELLRCRDQVLLLNKTYPFTDLLRVQQQIKADVTRAMNLGLTAQEQRGLHRDHPATAEAMDMYFRGQEYLSRFTPADSRRSLDYFREAIKRDEGYALAHAGLARALSSMAFEGLLPPSAFLEAEAAAKKALTLDQTLGAARDALAHVEFAYNWNPEAAQREFDLALYLSPDDEAIYRFYAVFLRTERLWDKSIAALNHAFKIKPSAEVLKGLGATYHWAGQHDKAIEQYNAALAFDGTHVQTYDLLADAYEAKGMYADAHSARGSYLRMAGAYEAGDALGSDASEDGYRRGMERLYRQYLQRLEQEAGRKDAFVPAMEFALTYIALGRTDEAFAALEEAYAQHTPYLASLAADPAFDPIRGDERFTRLLAKVKVPYR